MIIEHSLNRDGREITLIGGLKANKESNLQLHFLTLKVSLFAEKSK